jgi:hypothetical protein
MGRKTVIAIGAIAIVATLFVYLYLPTPVTAVLFAAVVLIVFGGGLWHLWQRGSDVT